MKAYHHYQRGLTLFEVSIAISVALAVLLSFAPYHIKLMERGLVEQTAQRAKMVYEAAINYRLDDRDGDGDSDGEWPSNTTELVNDGYLPDVALQTSWGGNIDLDSAGEDLQMKFSLPEMRFVNAVAAKLPVPKISGLEITQLIVRPGQEESLSQLQDLAGIRPWTGHHKAGDNDLTEVHTLKAKFIAAGEKVEVGASCSSEDGEEERDKPGVGARAIAEDDEVSVPVFCNGKIWVREDQMALSDCKVCVACKDGITWTPGRCNDASDNGWTQTEEACIYLDSLAVKFVCGKDSWDDWPNGKKKTR